MLNFYFIHYYVVMTKGTCVGQGFSSGVILHSSLKNRHLKVIKVKGKLYKQKNYYKNKMCFLLYHIFSKILQFS